MAIAVFAFLLICSYAHPFHIHPYRTYYHDVLSILGLVLAFAFLAAETVPRLRVPAIIYLFAGLLLWMGMQFITGHLENAADVSLPIIYIAALIAAIMIGATWAAKEGGVTLLCQALAVAHLLAGLLSVVLQCIQLSGLYAWPFVMYIATNTQPFVRPFANVAQPNQLALLLCFALASSFYLYRARKMPAWLVTVALVFLLWGLTLTHSRIGWVIVPAFVLMCGLGRSTVSGNAIEPRVSLVFCIAMALLYAGMVAALPSLGDVFGFSGGTIAEHVGGRSERMVLWSQAWRMAAEHPWFGVGWFGFGAEQVRIAADLGSGTYAEHAHNLILNFAAELGWPYTLVFMLTLAWWFVQTCVQPSTHLAIQFTRLCFVAVMVHSMVEFPLWYAYVLIPIGVLMGMVHQMRWPADGVRVAPAALSVLVAVSLLLMALISLDYQRVVAGFQALRSEQSGYKAPQAPMQKPVFTFFPQFFDYFTLTRINPHEGMSADEIAYLEKWGARFGFVHIINKLAEAYVLNGQPRKAERAMLSLQRLHPTVYTEYWDYWKAKSGQDERYKAIFIKMPPRDAP
ncbi:Wzy polymerase domain-containing protein [Undibacterium sp. Di26W]|uniref:PglL family O-oligosaccharyltransferase n=1 Tax=Undibacterium sp. Di26W TaxID=3413035 RepID=UPI003BF20100